MNKTFSNKIYTYLFVGVIVIISLFSSSYVYAGTLSCSVTTQASCSGTVIYRMSGSTNAHAQLPSESNINYNNNVVCCSGITGLSNSCSGIYAVALKLDKATNAHSQINSQTGYTNNACISVPAGGNITIGYVTDPITCASAGYDTALGTIYSNTNSHVGNTIAYSINICATGSATTLLPAKGVLTSSVFDTTANSASIGYNSMMWKGTLGTGGTGKVRFQLAASSSPTGPWVYHGGSTCGSLDWFDTSGPNVPVELKGTDCVTNFNNKRYFKYKVQVCSVANCVDQGTTSPVIDKIIVNWSS